MAVKYQHYFDEMLEIHQELFDHFLEIHDNFAKDPEKWRKQFNEEGEKVLSIIRRTENSLCGKSENSGYGRFSSNLSDKFWARVRTHFPKIDLIGTEA